jgi:GATA-binding protein
MKKTVIKRRKRVPAVGTTSRNSPGVPSQSEQNSPARSSVPVPPTATASGGAYPTPTESEKSHPSPYGAPPSLHETRSPSIFDPIGMRRQQQAVPLNLSGSAGGERKKPWWFDDRTPHQAKEAEPKDTKDQGVSLVPFIQVVSSFVVVSGDPHCSTEFQDPLSPLMFPTRLPSSC